MPTYDYRCAACSHVIEVFHSISESPKKKCPSCGKSKLERQIGAGAGILFKGGGFYQTDYRSDSYKKSEGAERSAAGNETKSGGASTNGNSAEGSAGTSAPEKQGASSDKGDGPGRKGEGSGKKGDGASAKGDASTSSKGDAKSTKPTPENKPSKSSAKRSRE